MMKRFLAQLGFGSAIALGFLGSLGIPVKAVQLADGTVAFVQPPRLLSASTTQKSTYAWGATYLFTLSVPAEAGESLQRVVIAQQPAPDTVKFNLDDSEAFEGDSNSLGTRIPLSSVTADPQTGNLTVIFAAPVAPGKTITIALRPQENPDVGGVYLFGVTAFPTGEKSYGQFLGYGRLHFYEDDGLFGLRRFFP